MSQTPQQLEARLEELTAQVQTLNARVDQLSARLNQPGAAVPATAAPAPVSLREGAIAPEDASEELVKWMGQSSLLPRISALCFLLVVALVLRTVTDTGLLDDQIGAYLGMTYAGALILAGWRLYARKSALAPIFTVCGAVLMYSIVVETHAHFESLPAVPAYFMIMLTGVATAVISFRHHIPLPILVGTFGMCLAGVAIDYPHPFFPYLSMVLITANILGSYATRLQSCSWLRWMVFGITAGMLHVWGIKLAFAMSKSAPVPPQLAAGWYVPTVLLFAAAFLGTALFGILRRGEDRISKFDLCLPALNGLWAFAALLHMVHPGRGWGVIGSLGLLAALAHLAIAYRLGQRRLPGAPGTNAFTVAGIILLAQTMPVLFGSEQLAITVLALSAPAMAWFAREWSSGGVRLSSYATQLLAAILLGYQALNSPANTAPVATSFAAGALALAGFFQFRWCRQVPPPADSVFFSRFDAENRLSIFLLLASLVGGFIFLRTGAYQLLLQLPGELENSFRGTQSVILNVAVGSLILLAFFRRNAELRNIAIFLTLIAAIKVFLFDLMGTSGLPLVASVFTFGLAIAIESVALGRWPRTAPVTEPTADAAEQADESSLPTG
jgi:uncharacterized membrane protein